MKLKTDEPKAVIKKPSRTLRSIRKRYNIWKQQKGLCAICGEPLDEDFEIDHIKAFSCGGLTIYPNLQATHRKCNRTKASK